MSASLSRTWTTRRTCQIPHPEDKSTRRGADATTVTTQRSIPSTPRTRASRAAAPCAAVLAAAALPASAAAGPGSGGGAVAWLIVAVGAAVLVFLLLRMRKGRRGSHTSLSDISDGRELLIARGRRVTGELTELAEPIAERDE